MNEINYKSEKIVYILTCCAVLAAILFLILYHINEWQFSGQTDPCYINRVWHLYCPACGGTRSLDYLFHGRILSSFLYNPLPVSALIFFLSYFIPATYTFVIKRNGNIYYHFQKKLLIFLILLNIFYFLIRNLSMILFHIDIIGENTRYWIR